ncbi:MAG TPA: hypothetical protein PKD55_05850 [Bellilinea sp.]|nr:hypothetical protein [Bellilinea sp.]
MPVQLTVKVTGADLVKKALEDLGAEIPKISEGRIYGRMMSARNRITTYPPRPAGYRVMFRSDRHRRGFFARLRSGAISVPYQRTGTYGRAWKVTRAGTGWRLSGRAVGGGGDYTELVGGSAYGTGQAGVHRGRWTTIRDAVEEAVKDLPGEIDRHISMVARRKGL